MKTIVSLAVGVFLINYVLGRSPMKCAQVDVSECSSSDCPCQRYVGECNCLRCYKCENQICSFVAGDLCQPGFECSLPPGHSASEKWTRDGVCRPVAS